MQYRELGRTGWNVSTVSFGACAILGAKRPSQVEENVRAADQLPFRMKR